MLRLYNNMPKDLGPTVSAVNRTAYRRILFSLCWYHSIIIERKRFKTLGWNIIYDYNDSDWDTADKILQLYIDETEEGVAVTLLKKIVGKDHRDLWD